MEAEKKAEQFLRNSLKFLDKEIAIPSNQFFSITELAEERDSLNHKSVFEIQYGFPSSGAVFLRVILDASKEKLHAIITDFTVHTQPANKSLIVANYSSQSSAGLPELGASIKFGFDTNTVEHENYEKIDKNPNALQMIDLAIDDLNNAIVLGECRMCYETKTNHIACCNTVPYSQNKNEDEDEDEHDHKK